jgi:hypothetical protein
MVGLEKVGEVVNGVDIVLFRERLDRKDRREGGTRSLGSETGIGFPFKRS